MSAEDDPSCARPAGAEPDPDRCWTYCTKHPWKENCALCGEEIKMTYAQAEVLGPYCYGCFGYPACSCAVAHTGDCSAPKPLKEKR